MSDTNGTSWELEPPDWPVSVIRNVNDTDPRPARFRAVIADICSPKWEDRIAKCRAAYLHGFEHATPKAVRGVMETMEQARLRSAKDAAAPIKESLPGVLFSGLFSHRSNGALTKHSGLICVDLDKLGQRGEQVETTFEHIVADPHTLACFRSPTGTGLKVVLRCDPEKGHDLAFAAARRHFLSTFGLEIDEACKDVCRICFASSDPAAFVADDATPLPYPAGLLDKPKEFKPLHALQDGDKPGDEYDRRADVPALLLSHGWTKAHGPYWTRPGKSRGVSASWNVAPNRFWCFSSSVAGIQEGHLYRPWHLYALLQHNGDFAKAAKALAADGYGTPLPGERLLPKDNSPTPTPSDLENRRVRLSAPPKEPQTRLFLAGKPVCTPGNLTTLISRAKTGKTATIGGAVAAIIAAHYDRVDLDTLGFTAPHTSEAVVLIDTEQSPYDAWTCHQRALSRAAQPEDPPWLCHYALVGYSAKQLREALPIILEQARQTHGGIFTIILDGVADFVNSVNDEAECNDYIAQLRSLTVAYDCPLIAVIHSNEGVKTGDDGRGHLGKQLTRKAESNLLLKKVGEVTTITSEKQRKAPITEADNIAFRWDHDTQRHQLCPADSVPQGKLGGKPKKYFFDDFTSIFPTDPAKAMSRQALYRYAQDFSDIKDTAFRDLLAGAVQRGELERTQRGQGFLYHMPKPPAPASE